MFVLSWFTFKISATPHEISWLSPQNDTSNFKCSPSFAFIANHTRRKAQQTKLSQNKNSSNAQVSKSAHTLTLKVK